MIRQEEYLARRKKLAQQLSDNSLAIIPAAQEVMRNGDSHYRFRQDSNFYYLTGFNEPDALLVITAEPHSQSILFNRTRNIAEEQWTGKRLGQEGALATLDINEAYPIEQLTNKLPSLLMNRTAVFYAFGANPSLEKQITDAITQVKAQIRRGIKAPANLCDLQPLLSEMRLFKSEAEQNLMRQAARISIAGHQRAMKACAQLTHEHELEAELLYEFFRQGCRSVAYDSIVGGGENACILHYTANNQPLKKGDLVLIDAGGEYEYYASDITRTFPINGCFSPEQKAIYELVLKAQKVGIACIKPGTPWNKPQQLIIQILTQGLCELGLLQGDVDELIAKEAYRAFYMHNSGHWLGLDVHDVGAYKINNEWRPFEAGMVLTVEPGLYISANTAGVDKRWWNIGVRIEDDVLVTPSGHEVLTAALPVNVAEIEALMRA